MYFTLQVTRNNDGAFAVSSFSFESIDAAKANHHYFLSSSYSNNALSYFMGTLQNATGDVLACESWFKPPET